MSDTRDSRNNTDGTISADDNETSSAKSDDFHDTVTMGDSAVSSESGTSDVFGASDSSDNSGCFGAPEKFGELGGAGESAESVQSVKTVQTVHKKRHPLIMLLLALVLTVAIPGGYLWYEAATFISTPPESSGSEVRFIVPRGASFSRIAKDLQGAGVVTDATRFRLFARYKGKTGDIKAGEFLLNTSWTPQQVLDALVAGKSVLYSLTLREGLAWWDTAAEIERQGFAPADEFRKVIHDPDFLRNSHIPQNLFSNAEGFLFPETYHLLKPREMNREAAVRIANLLVDMFWQRTSGVWSEFPPPDDELERILILATLVEKETAVPEERRTVAGVYANRLRKGMRLQADPTVIYGIGPEFNGNITRKNLRDKSNPYNTYVRGGLPPGPICSPGLEAIRAAADPEEHKYLYFVAKGDGSHYFSRTLKEHNNAVRKYLLGK